MQWRELYIYGASGHGKVVADIAINAQMPYLKGFVDDDPKKMNQSLVGLQVLGDGQWLLSRAHQTDVAVLLGLGDNRLRHRVAQKCRANRIVLPSAIHPRAVVAHTASIKDGATIMALAVINPDALVDEGAIINTAAVVEHDVIVGQFAHLSPNATTGGGARVYNFAHVGLGASVLPGIVVNEGAVVGSGSVVTSHIAANAVVAGVPARALAVHATP